MACDCDYCIQIPVDAEPSQDDLLVRLVHTIDRAEKNRTMAIRTMEAGIALLELAQHALIHNHSDVTEEYIERVRDSLDKARTELRERQ